MPQSLTLLRTRFRAMRLSWVGPNSSVRRIPPEFPIDLLPSTMELATLRRWIPSPQSPPPFGVQNTYGEAGLSLPKSLPVTSLWRIFTSVIGVPVNSGMPATVSGTGSGLTARMPSHSAPSTLKPSTVTREDSIVMPLKGA